jgi:hypothetical protein
VFEGMHNGMLDREREKKKQQRKKEETFPGLLRRKLFLNLKVNKQKNKQNVP